MRIIDAPLSLTELKQIANERFGDMIKAVVDVEKGIMAIGAELHADEEADLLSSGSKQDQLWGINIYVDQPRETWIEFDSMVNIRPSQGNRSRSVEDQEMRQKIMAIVTRLIR